MQKTNLRTSMSRPGGPPGTKPLSRIMFEKYDKDQSGCIDRDEFKRLCMEMGCFLSDEEHTLAVAVLDGSGDGRIQYDEFVAWWKKGEGRWAQFSLDDEQLAILQGASSYFI